MNVNNGKKPFTCEFVGEDGQLIYKNHIGYNNDGDVYALYYLPNQEKNPFYKEKIGKFDTDYKEYTVYKYEFKLNELMAEHIDEVHKTHEYITQTLGMRLADAMKSGVFIDCRMDTIRAKALQEPIETAEQKVQRFINCIEMRNWNDYSLKLNVDSDFDKDGASSFSPIVQIDEGPCIIIDDVLPLEASVARLLALDLTSKMPRPSVSCVIDTWFEAHDLRSICYPFIKNYQYYFEKDVILNKKEDLKNKKIDQDFIERVISKQYVYENHRKRLEQFIGKTFKEALVMESGIYGNMKRVRDLLNEEIEAIDEADKFLFSNIYMLCNTTRSKEKIIKYVNLDFLNWNYVQEKYAYFAGNEGLSKVQIELKDKGSPFLGDTFRHPAWKKLKRIYKYLKGKEQEISLDLSDQALRELLKVIKMFHLAIAVHNCGVPASEKNVFEKGSYELRLAIQERDRKLQSFEVHTKKLSLDALKEKAIEEYRKLDDGYKKEVPLDVFVEKKIDEYRSVSHHWEAERVRLHARLFQKTYIEAQVLSDLIAKREVDAPQGDSSSRGTLCSGKSTGTPDVMGVLNPDFIKWRLREETSFTNFQIHEEGSMLFKCCFNEVKKNIKYHILDLCLKKLGDVNKYLTEPAQKNNCSIFISDHAVPLPTSLNRILLREPRDKDPITTLENLVNSFNEIQQNRKEILDATEKNDLFEQYDLHYLGELIGQKINGKFEIFDEEKYKQCLIVPAEDEIEDEVNRIIDDQYVYEALARGDFRPDQAPLFLKKWSGCSVKAAIETHAMS